MNETQADAPFTALEQQLARIWCDVIRVETISRADDFFDLGAHSLLITQIISRVRQELGAELTMRDIFDNPTFGDFAAIVAQRMNLEAMASSAAAIPPAKAA